jgi:predicted membrane protein
MNILSGTITQNADDSLSTTTIFGDIKRTVLSKDFKGGSVRNVFGNTELDFTQADLTGIAVLDISQAFGQVTIAIPIDWRVETEITHIASEMDDDRSYLIRTRKSNKVLVLKGLSVFAAVEIVNFLEE